MARIFITGSADGLGKLAAGELIRLGHEVVLHARDAERAKHALNNLPGAHDVLIGDLSSLDETKALASKANVSGKFDAVIHNAGIYRVSRDSVTADGWPLIFAVNTIAPYVLTCLMHKPKRLVYLSSGMHFQGNSTLNNLITRAHNRTNYVTYSDTKLHDVILAMAVAQRYPDIYANAVDPGWVPTKMGGAAAPDSLEKGFQTQVWLAVSNDPEARVSGHYFHHKTKAGYLPAARDIAVQEKFLKLCEQVTGVQLNFIRSKI